jgi:mevalonate kinase
MKGPLFYSKILLLENGIIRDSKGLSIPYNFYNGALKEMKTLLQKRLHPMQA